MYHYTYESVHSGWGRNFNDLDSVQTDSEAHNGYEGPCLEGKQPRREAYQSPTCQTKVQNVWFCASSSIRL